MRIHCPHCSSFWDCFVLHTDEWVNVRCRRCGYLYWEFG